MSSFQGFPRGLFEFFTELQADNSKVFWQTNKHRYEHDVRTPMHALLSELTDEFGPLRMFRPNRDVRFSTDKSPYKLWTGATSEARAVGGVGYYLEVSATGIVTGYGAMLMVPEQLRRYRAAIDNEKSGSQFEELVDSLAERSLSVSHGAEDPLKTAPRGYTANHPRIRHLRWKGAAVIQEWPKDDWMHSPRTLDAIRRV
ncbi:DUF2461 domain-containing protein [Corynebacterium casei]|nr:DUF2461 domain-containing protein [Corynebacterium casei]MDN5807883.1 DUF2461 domain-containing protein [Brevibacterium sp.]AHI18646.1 hypothetical protein CCASEI_00305 [Corynebacterium casei LMG S-19264]MDN5783167.1 DUF2461 domain-containing protein [Corynebacterium casei]MDN5841415.1 DUF2461 domain-containing protein [Corynebacterium casei]MDN6159204.1 DUF2461 domain-containing protein [Brevibacterium sp.]